MSPATAPSADPACAHHPDAGPGVDDPASRLAPLSSLVTVIDKSVRGMDQKLGYRGQDRFVLFYYEPRGEEVVWRDTRSYGFARGAWTVFHDELAPVADLHGAHVGCDAAAARHVLLVDRQDRRAYFVDRDEAVRFLAAVAAGRAGVVDDGAAGAVPAAPMPDLPASVEVTRETLAKLAYEIWERNGRLEGHYLEDWLEAEARLTAAARQAGRPRSSLNVAGRR